MKVKRFVLGIAGTNCYVFDHNDLVFVIDPGENPEPVINYINENWGRVDYILITHCHFDHIAGIDQIVEKFSVDNVFCPEGEIEWLKNSQNNLSRMCDLEIVIKSKVKPLQEEIENIIVINTPGHSKDSKSFYIEEKKIIFSGDAIFKNNIGRCDLPNSSLNILVNSVKNNLLTLPGNTKVYPGHGFSTTIEEEKNSNPYFK